MDLIRKITKSRSKSPTKRSKSPRKEVNGMTSISVPSNGMMPHSSHYPPPQPPAFPPPLELRGSNYTPQEFPPVCYLPLPPSPHLPQRTSSPHLPLPPSPYLPRRTPSPHTPIGSAHSADSVHTWNSEKNLEDGGFFLSNEATPNTVEDRVFEVPSGGPLMKARSHSPHKRQPHLSDKLTSRSKSPQKKRTIAHTLDYLNSQCHLEGCSAAIVVQSTRFLVCRHQLSHASVYFRDLFSAETSNRQPEINVVVSEMSVPPPATQFRWFLESSVPCPGLKDISDDTLETCMRLSKRFQAAGLEIRCAKFIYQNAASRQPIVVLCWLNWCLKHRFDVAVQQSCLPTVARLSLISLEQHRHMLTERIYSEILAAKLRGCYDKAVSVFRTIHRMDHFSCELAQCPRCGRTKDHLKLRVFAIPCRKMIGCERCLRDYGCEIEAKDHGDLQAYYQCQHALVPLNDSTEECECQTSNLAGHLRASLSSERGRSKQKRERTDSKRK